MTLKIISTTDIVFEGPVEAVHFPGANGRFTVLKNHAALISALVKGQISYRDVDGNDAKYDINGGVADINNNVISVCVF